LGAAASKLPSGTFDLIDHFGRQATNRSFHGKYLLVFFGFTHCRVVCPRALTKLSATLDALGSLRRKIQPLYITVDPERDTPERMRDFLQNYPRFLGLTGSRAQIEEAKHAFCVFARRTLDPEDSEGYSVPHTAICYFLHANGKSLIHFVDALSTEQIVRRLTSYMKE
jgi:protein SCO1/2